MKLFKTRIDNDIKKFFNAILEKGNPLNNDFIELLTAKLVQNLMLIQHI